METKPIEPIIRNVSDTARWVAIHRALESERPDAHFKDPFARRLAGPRGEQMLDIPNSRASGWVVSSRTVIINELIHRLLGEGVETVVNLAAGLDTRPFWMDLPPTLRWIEVDLPGILDEKARVLAGQEPVCRFEQVRLDLAEAGPRRALFERLGRESRKALVLTEGLLMYLGPEDVAALAKDLAATPAFRLWMTDLLSPATVRLIQASWGQAQNANAPIRFGPAERERFFAPYGWRPREVRSLFKEAARLRRLGVVPSLMARLPEPRWTGWPWSGICLLEPAAGGAP